MWDCCDASGNECLESLQDTLKSEGYGGNRTKRTAQDKEAVSQSEIFDDVGYYPAAPKKGL